MWNQLTRVVRCHSDDRGTLVAWEEPVVPFATSRVFFLVDLPVGAERGGHAHKECHELVICLAGAMRVRLATTSDQQDFILNRPDQGLHIPPGHWIELTVESPNTVVAVLCSDPYIESDYQRTWAEFAEERG